MSLHENHQPSTPVKVQKFRFHRSDRISIGKVHFVCKETLPNGHVFERFDDPELTQFFAHDEVDKLLQCGALSHDPKFYASATQTMLSHTEILCLAALPEKERILTTRRYEYVRRFLVHEAAWAAEVAKKRGKRAVLSKSEVEKTTRSDAVMGKIINTINADMQQVDYVGALAATGHKRSPYGTVSVIYKAISGRTLRRWLTAYEAFEPGATGARPELAILGLRPRFRVCGNRTPFYDFDAYKFIRKHAVAYAAQDRPSVKGCHNKMMAAFDAFNLERTARGLKPIEVLPSQSLLREHIQSLDKFTVYAQRKSIAKARMKFGPTGQGPDVERALQRVEMDAWIVHLKTLFEASGFYEFLTPEQRDKIERVRMCLTVIIDCASRCILAMTLTATEDSEAGVRALAMMMSDKSEIARGAGAKAGWPMIGTPEALFVDNGYSSSAFRAAAIGAMPHASVTPAGLPWLRPYIERVFRTFDLHLMPLFSGRTFCNPVDAEGYDSEALATLTVEELADIFVRYVVDIYHLTPHEGLKGETPYDAWFRLNDECAVHPAPNKIKFTSVFGQSRTPRISKAGLRFINLFFQSEELQDWYRRKGDIDVEIRVHPNDISYAVAKFDGGWHRLTPTEDGFQNVSIKDYAAALKYARARNADKAKIHSDIVKQALRDLAEVGQAGRQRMGIYEAPHSRAELDHAERMFGETTHVSISHEAEVLKPSAPVAPPNGFDAVFEVGGKSPDATGEPLTKKHAERRRRPAGSVSKPESEAAPAKSAQPESDFSFEDEDD